MNDKDYQELKGRLQEKRDTIHRRIRKIHADVQQEDGPLDRDPEDQAIELENEEVLDRLEPQSRKELADVLAALERMEEGEYGQCLDCDGEIGVKRLKALPWARYCIDCAEAREL